MMYLRQLSGLAGQAGLFRVTVILLLIHSFAVLVMSWHAPIVDMHDFRQTQTALTTYWLIENGFSLAYETPVVGAPWSIPFEFPVYQALTAWISMLGIPLDSAGRLVSYVFFVACLWPMHSLGRDLRLNNFWFYTTAAMFLASPIYIFWGRSFMIETTALFFSMAHLSMLVAFLRLGGLYRAILATAFGILAVLAKATTLPVFSLLAGIFGLYYFYTEYWAKSRFGPIRLWLPTGLSLIIPYPVGLAWVAFTDSVKVKNLVGTTLTSDALSHWNYGTLDLRMSGRFWSDIVLERILPDILGIAGTAALVVFLILQIFPRIHVSLTRSQSTLLALSLVSFLLPMMLFTNLHFVHNYYQTANAVFLIAAIGIIAAGFQTAGRPYAATAVVLFTIGSQLVFFHAKYYKMTVNPYESPHYSIARAAQDLTPENSGLLVFGTDWTSTIAYYAQRKALTAPNWIGTERVIALTADTSTTLGGLDLGGVVSCTYGELEFQDVVDRFVQDRAVLAQAGVCTLYAGDVLR